MLGVTTHTIRARENQVPQAPDGEEEGAGEQTPDGHRRTKKGGGLRLCGQPFAVSADASWRQMRDEYLYTGGTPGAVRAGGTDAAGAPNLDAHTKRRV